MFLDQTADRQRLPVVLLCGFAGSGKTTLVNVLLRDPRLAETAVAINEFGEIPLDMEGTMTRIFARRQSGDLPAFRRLIVECPGLADPAPIAQDILRNPTLSPGLRLASIMTTVDALSAGGHVARHEAFRKQMVLADTIVLTKTDLVDEQGLVQAVAVVRDANPAARLVLAVKGCTYAADLLPACFIDPLAPDADKPLNCVDADPAKALSPTTLVGAMPV